MKGRKPEQPSELEGVVIAAATPRRAHEHSIDLGATLELIDFLGESQARAIVLLGSAGEFVHFALDDRLHMVNFASRRSRLPFVVNVSYSTLDGAAELTRQAASAGAEGVFLLPPYYFRHDQESIAAFYLSFAQAAGDAVPIYIANEPDFASGIAIDTAIRLLATGSFAGFQDSSGIPGNLCALAGQARQTPFTLLTGCDRAYGRALEAGARGIVSNAASAVPELMVALDRALRLGEKERAEQLQARVSQFLDWTEQLPFPLGVKEAARERKLKMGAPAVPLSDSAARKLDAFREWFRAWLPDVLRECSSPAVPRD